MRVLIFSEDPRAVRGRERVELALQLLLGRTATGVPGSDRRPVRLRLRRDGLRSLRPLLARAPVTRDGDGELVAQRRHEDEPGDVVLRGGLPSPCPARASRRRLALLAGMAFDRGCGLFRGQDHYRFSQNSLSHRRGCERCCAKRDLRERGTDRAVRKNSHIWSFMRTRPLNAIGWEELFRFFTFDAVNRVRLRSHRPLSLAQKNPKIPSSKSLPRHIRPILGEYYRNPADGRRCHRVPPRPGRCPWSRGSGARP